MTSPAAELRAAAEKLRKLASSATGSEGSWRYAKSIPSDSVRTATGWEIAYGYEPKDLNYIAAMGPTVGLALADWLDHEAEVQAAVEREQWTQTDPCGWCGNSHALAVARAINTPAP